MEKNRSLEGTKYPLAVSKDKERDPYPDTSGWGSIRKTKMIKTLRITSVVAVVLAVFFFVFPAVFSVRSDEQVEQFLSFPGVIEKFNKAKGDSDKRSESQISPLVKEAQAFALYLNPPPKPKKETRPIPKKTTPPKPRPQAPVSPKFKLVGVSYYASHPELSLALIDEPGRGTRWVRQSSKVSHLIIEQVKDGLVVVRDGKRTFELKPKTQEEKSLVIKGSSSGRTGSKSTLMPSIGADAAVKSDKAPQQLGTKKEVASLKKTGVKSDKAPPQLGAEEETASLKTTAVKSDEAPQQLGTKKEVASLKKTGVKSDKAQQQLSAEEEMASLKKAINGLKAMKVEVESGESDTIIKEFVSDLEAEVMSISAEEAKNLGHLGKELKDVGADLNRAKDSGSELAELGAAEPEAEAKAEPEVPKAEPEVPKAEPEVPKTEPEVPKTEPEVPKTEPEDEKGDEAPEGETAQDEPSESETPAAEAPESKTPENRRERTFCGYTQSQLMELHRTNPKEFWDIMWNCDDI